MESAPRSYITGILAFLALGFASAHAQDVMTGKTAYVHLFEWKWTDIAQECEQFLGPKGFGAVQVSPPNEHAVLPGQPWYQRYQPVSYKLVSRSGTRAEFVDMVQRCKAAGVSVYVDAVINHMAKVLRTGPRVGFAGSPFEDYSFPGTYAPWDFHHCGHNGSNGLDQIDDYRNRWVVQNCELDHLADLRTESEYVRSTIAWYLRDLLEIGVAGFRIDAAKHIPAEDIAAIFARLNRPFYPYQEVINNPGEAVSVYEYFGTGDAMEFMYPKKIWEVFTGYYGQNLSNLQHFGPSWNFIPNNKAVVFVDNHDQQRGHGAGGYVLTYKDGQRYSLANVFMLAWPYGYPQVMSSFRFVTDQQGPPSDEKGNTESVFQNGVSQCGKNWVCEHRWPAIAAMVGFRNATQSAPQVNKWWSNGNNLISFARGDRGYIVINGENQETKRWFDTGLPAGEYCDVISGDRIRAGGCAGKTITVNRDGWAEIHVAAQSAAAIHVQARRY